MIPIGSLFETRGLSPALPGTAGSVLSPRDRLRPGPHYDAAALPTDQPGVKVTVLSQSIQSHDLPYPLIGRGGGFDCFDVI